MPRGAESAQSRAAMMGSSAMAPKDWWGGIGGALGERAEVREPTVPKLVAQDLVASEGDRLHEPPLDTCVKPRAGTRCRDWSAVP